MSIFDREKKAAEICKLIDDVDPQGLINPLDDFVYSVSEEIAAAINNTGPYEQVMYLLENDVRYEDIINVVKRETNS